LFNHELANWLEEYNNVRPHQALDYLTPLAYIDSYLNTHVLPMSSSRTEHCFFLINLIYSFRLKISIK
ncbi:MAG TPA: integrase core domain-containing protein, partial [Candidatus Saccharimonadales bacterium]|nr:integrase core domain-containing protein [Candidatus Saccharimonadales bacterium]